MARFDCSGIEQIIAEMERLGEDIGPLADDMLMEGAEIVADEWKKSADRHRLVDTEQMRDSIGYPKKPERIGDIRSIDIYPQGRRKTKTGKPGPRNAEVAFIKNYGAKGKDATHFIDEADEISGEKIAEKFNKKMTDYINRRKK